MDKLKNVRDRIGYTIHFRVHKIFKDHVKSLVPA